MEKNKETGPVLVVVGEKFRSPVYLLPFVYGPKTEPLSRTFKVLHCVLLLSSRGPLLPVPSVPTAC